MISGEEIVRISNFYQLERGDVYKIRSLYGAMCKLYQQESDEKS